MVMARGCCFPTSLFFPPLWYKYFLDLCFSSFLSDFFPPFSLSSYIVTAALFNHSHAEHRADGGGNCNHLPGVAIHDFPQSADYRWVESKFTRKSAFARWCTSLNTSNLIDGSTERQQRDGNATMIDNGLLGIFMFFFALSHTVAR